MRSEEPPDRDQERAEPALLGGGVGVVQPGQHWLGPVWIGEDGSHRQQDPAKSETLRGRGNGLCDPVPESSV